jgi:hypothetical protein
MGEHKGSCFCGEVEIAVKGDPAAMGYCHCTDCRAWAAAPVNAFTLWPEGHVTVTKGQGHLGSYNKTDRSERQFCRSCGGHVMTKHPQMGLTDVYAATIPDFDYKPQLHVHYREAVLPIRDGLPKMKDVPAEMGGSGETLPE